MRKKIFFLAFVSFLFLGTFLFGVSVNADRIEKMREVPVDNSFPIGPSQISIEAEPGEVITKEIQIDNRVGEVRNFHVEVEDFEGSKNDPQQTVLLQGEKRGQFGAKDWFSLENYDFSIDHGERQYLDVTIKVPQNADVGDHYASVLVSMIPKDDVEKKEGANVKITSRAGILFFIKIKGDVLTQGKLNSFEVQKEHYFNLPGEKNRDEKKVNPVVFELVFKNDSSIRLRPSGEIEIKNMLGKTSDVIQIEEYNVLRDSTRQMDYTWEKTGFMFGKYTASLNLNRGYDNLVDTGEVSFWIIPWKHILSGIVILIVLIVVLWILKKNVHVKIGKEN